MNDHLAPWCAAAALVIFTSKAAHAAPVHDYASPLPTPIQALRARAASTSEDGSSSSTSSANDSWASWDYYKLQAEKNLYQIACFGLLIVAVGIAIYFFLRRRKHAKNKAAKNTDGLDTNQVQTRQYTTSSECKCRGEVHEADCLAG